MSQETLIYLKDLKMPTKKLLRTLKLKKPLLMLVMVKVLVPVKECAELDILLLNQKLNPAAQLLPQNPAALRFPYCAIATLSIPISVNSSRIQTLPKTKLFLAATTKPLFLLRDQEPPLIKELIRLPSQTF
jgi:hypothetical protein